MPDRPQPEAPPPTAQPVGNAPAAAGMTTPQEPSGELEAAKMDVYFAVKLLDRAVSKFGKSEDGDFALRARAMLTKRFGEHEETSEEFAPSEMKRMLATIAGPGASGPSAPTSPQSAPQGAPSPLQQGA